MCLPQQLPRILRPVKPSGRENERTSLHGASRRQAKAMAARTILWMDLRTTLSEPDLCSSLPKSYSAQRVRQLRELLPAVQSRCPWAVCFEYDVPDDSGLEALAEVKRHHPALPIVMLTERHAKTLANWAFRRCVWDYVVKPVSVRYLCRCLTSIDKAAPPAERPGRQVLTAAGPMP